jgi:Ni,Fe-hydrogenase III small subunit/ferredoxin-like protein FixX
LFDLVKARIKHGYQAVPNIRTAKVHEKFRGLPVIDSAKISKTELKSCINNCPTQAMTENPTSIDLGKCVFCGDCERLCANKGIQFTNFHYLASDSREHLVVREGIGTGNYRSKAYEVRSEIMRIFGRSLKLRSVSAGGCNACEMELTASNNVNFDIGRFGIEVVASPRHADGIVITGPISENMALALEDTYKATPAPKIIILMGACAISGGVFAESPALNRSFLERHPADIFIPGCPTHPLTFINGVLGFLGRE